MGYERFTRKRHALDTLPQVFADHRMRGNETDETLIVELYQQIGKLKVQLDWLKKKSDLFGKVRPIRNRREALMDQPRTWKLEHCPAMCTCRPVLETKGNDWRLVG